MPPLLAHSSSQGVKCSILTVQDSARRSDLPDYTNPPIIEVALSVSFKRLLQYTAAHSGLFWSQVIDRFPLAQEQLPLQIPPELETPALSEPRMQLEMGPAPSRTWLVTADGSELIQLQNDTFAHNWRQQESEGSAYPRYEHVRGQFDQEFQRFHDFIVGRGLGSVEPTVCDITYVNHIEVGSGVNLGDLGKVIAPCVPNWRGGFMGGSEDSRYMAKFAIRERGGPFIGRLTVNAQPAIRRKDKQQLIVLTLTARGRPLGTGIDGVRSFFDVGHVWIVKGFTDITTPEMHQLWGRTA